MFTAARAARLGVGARSRPPRSTATPTPPGLRVGDPRVDCTAYTMGKTTDRLATCAPSSYVGKTEPRIAMTDHDDVLAANLEFYRAFAARDLAAMDALWARRAPVACLHPGWTALRDRDEIIESWAGIFSNPDAPRLACFDEHAFIYGDTALVLCEEELEAGTL